MAKKIGFAHLSKADRKAIASKAGRASAKARKSAAKKAK